ncbi:hypothetical protein [Absidia glauca]|uniref:Brl1/Brr6 domain-containing protein n=1 Tax=Absidia glauca TaxID=4829 RepID=A0A168RZ16_ABSGL|nr:hypothetical protein [Absidia glauca]
MSANKRRKTTHETFSEPSVWRNPFSFSSETPLILSSYAGLIFYTIVTTATFILLFLGLRAIQQEISVRIRQHAYDLEDSIDQCRQKYRENQCSAMATSPILSKYCEEWLKYPFYPLYRSNSFPSTYMTLTFLFIYA